MPDLSAHVAFFVRVRAGDLSALEESPLVTRSAPGRTATAVCSHTCRRALTAFRPLHQPVASTRGRVAAMERPS